MKGKSTKPPAPLDLPPGVSGCVGCLGEMLSPLPELFFLLFYLLERLYQKVIKRQ